MLPKYRVRYGKGEDDSVWRALEDGPKICCDTGEVEEKSRFPDGKAPKRKLPFEIDGTKKTDPYLSSKLQYCPVAQACRGKRDMDLFQKYFAVFRAMIYHR